VQPINSLSQLGFTPNSKLLCVFAHPDDETAFSGGLIHQATKMGAITRLICLTKGEKSTLHFGMKEKDVLEEVRGRELREACGYLGVEDIQQCDIPDGELENYQTKINYILIQEIDTFKPDFVLTMEPNGIYGHPDHICLSGIVLKLHLKYHASFRIIQSTADSRYYQPDNGMKKMAKSPVAPSKPMIALVMDESDRRCKAFAMRAHESQFYENANFLRKWEKQTLLSREYFCMI
jgi:LmbE family N-acetylglucosaminyl deacetylase